VVSTPVSDAAERRLRIPVLLWMHLVVALCRRGQRQRESGAFLLGRRGDGGEDVVRRYVCYDDLDPHALDRGIVVFDGTGFGKLWAICREKGWKVLGDVHTHGTIHTQQSEADRTNPMMPKLGHIALIVPRFAQTWCWGFSGVGIYEYRGDHQWRDWTGARRADRVRFTWW
jgi:proteasome lid subunit RPN8/RPN11